MYQEIELWKAEQAKKRNQKTNKPAKEAKPDKDALLSAALAQCFAMGVQTICHANMSYQNYKVNTTING